MDKFIEIIAKVISKLGLNGNTGIVILLLFMVYLIYKVYRLSNEILNLKKIAEAKCQIATVIPKIDDIKKEMARAKLAEEIDIKLDHIQEQIIRVVTIIEIIVNKNNNSNN